MVYSAADRLQDSFIQIQCIIYKGIHASTRNINNSDLCIVQSSVAYLLIYIYWLDDACMHARLMLTLGCRPKCHQLESSQDHSQSFSISDKLARLIPARSWSPKGSQTSSHINKIMHIIHKSSSQSTQYVSP